MILLDGNSLFTPDPGTVFWTLLVFALLWFLLAKFAFKPISKALGKREKSIEDALNSAEKARQEIKDITAENEAILNSTKEERNNVLREAKEMKDKIIGEARGKAKIEAAKIMDETRREIENRKQEAIVELKNQAGMLAIKLAEDLLGEEMKDKSRQKEIILRGTNDIKAN